MHTETPYERLTPETILDAIEHFGLAPTGSLLALNSYENRVYQIEINEGGYVVAKFYRPGRWTDAAIQEEHDFSQELASQEIPVVPPMLSQQQRSLESFADFRFAVFARQGGRWPELENPDNLEQLGRFLGRIHQLGQRYPFTQRTRLTVDNYGKAALAFLLDNNFVAEDVRVNYQTTAQMLLALIEEKFQQQGEIRYLRLHGDCHPGNILWTDQGPHFVDLDDCCMGPAIQDLWMLLSGSTQEMALQCRALLNGYEVFCDFDYLQLHLIEALRGLRLLHYSAWLARRWHDPAFPMHFPWFNTPRYWEEQLYVLREQVERLQQPVLQV